MAQQTLLTSGATPRRRPTRPDVRQAAARAQARLDIDAGDGHTGWRLDEHTRQVGRRGLAAARAALQATRSPAA